MMAWRLPLARRHRGNTGVPFYGMPVVAKWLGMIVQQKAHCAGCHLVIA